MQGPHGVANGRFPATAFFGGLFVVTALAVLDLLSHVSVVGGVMIGVFIGALAASPRRVALLGVYGFAWILVLGFNGHHWNLGHWIRLALAVLATGVAVAAAVSRDRHIVVLARTVALADAAQRALIRPLGTSFDDAEIALRYLPSTDGALVGGDVYEAESTRWGVRVLIADVCGHGLPAVEQASTIVFAFREAAHSQESLRDIVDVMERSFRRRSTYPDFATCLMLQVHDGAVEIVNCGHPDPLLVDTCGARWVETSTRSTPLGLDPHPCSTRITPPAGSTLLLYTDGLVEARDRAGRFFDLEHVATDAFATHSVDEGLDVLIDAVHAHAGPSLCDDLLVMAIRVRRPCD